jgi:hypothetical protein
VSKSTTQLDEIGPIFTDVAVVEHAFFSLGTVSQLLELVRRHAALYVRISGICGNAEGISLDVELCTENTAIHIATEGLYGLKNASKTATGLTLTIELNHALLTLGMDQANLNNLCQLMLRPRLSRQHNVVIHIRHIALIAHSKA